MPSHISHALLVEAALTTIEHGPALPAEPAVLGAQGPDIFLHNHRRKPRGFRYGALLHRKGNAGVVASIARSAVDTLPEESDGFREIAAFTLGYISHIWLDRLLHPYVNYCAGWRGAPDHALERPAMHAFLERIIDVQLLRLLRQTSIEEYRFIDRLPPAKNTTGRLRTHVANALRSSLTSAKEDHLLERRLANAFFDSLGYYRHTESPGPEYFASGRARERSGGISYRWLSVIHPPEELLAIDSLNLERRRWQHPCDPSRTSNVDVPALFERALVRTTESYALWLACVRARSSSESVHRLTKDLGIENLNDGITGDPPCRRKTCDPLPLLDLYRRIKSSFDR